VPNHKKSFTLLELLIVIAIATIIAGGLVPLFGTTKQDAKIAKLVSLTDTLRTACMAYYLDTGEYGKEFAGASQDCNAGIGMRELSCADGVVDWAGPYLNHPFVNDDIPYVASGIGVADTSCVFDLNGDGTFEIQGNGNYLYFTITSMGLANADALAKKLNDIIDKSVPGNWRETGKLRYATSGGDYDIWIYLFKSR